jgi:UDP-galactopyranose mutase
MKYDYVVVGAGLFGSVVAKELTKRGKKVLVVDKRTYIGGNCHSFDVQGIDVHEHGPHIFHTTDKKIWDYVNKIAEFNNFTYRPKVNYHNNIYSFPINLLTFYQLWGIKTPNEANKKLEEVRVKINEPQNFEEYALSVIGEELYNIFFYGYTKKQWGKEPKELPISIFKRIPIRLTYDDNYFLNNPYQGVPINGYNNFFKNLLEGIEVKLEVDYLEEKSTFNHITDKIIYTGKIDEFYDYKFGKLEYRSLEFTHTLCPQNYQGVAVVNYTDENIPITRSIEHVHFSRNDDFSLVGVLTKEKPSSVGEAYYPINTEVNNEIYNKYADIKTSNVIFGGRLGYYQYLNMDEAVTKALNLVSKLEDNINLGR